MQKRVKKRGKLIVLDGGDGSGKTEQTDRLVKRMSAEGYPVATKSFPRYGMKSAGPVEDYLGKGRDTPGMGAYGPIDEIGPRQASILYAIDRWAAYRQGDFAPLEQGTHMVLNRYVASNMGHQGSKISDPKERSAYFRWNDDLEFGIFGIPRPDINLILHVPAEVAISLIDGRGIAKDGHENLEHLKRAEATYLEIARSFPNFVLIECMDSAGNLMTPEKIHDLVWTHIQPLL